MATMQDMQEFNNLSSLVQMSSNGDGDKNALDKKTRREIANSNERRRMQSINTGFLRLKSLVPSISKEKVSKVSWDKKKFENSKKFWFEILKWFSNREFFHKKWPNPKIGGQRCPPNSDNHPSEPDSEVSGQTCPCSRLLVSAGLCPS